GGCAPSQSADYSQLNGISTRCRASRGSPGSRGGGFKLLRLPAFRCRSDEPAPIVLDREGRQPSRQIGARIDADAIAALLHRVDDGVAVNHDEAMFLGVGEKRLADPTQVGGILLLHGDARADARVDEEIVAEA